MVRIKATGKVTEVSRPVMRALRSFEMKQKRLMAIEGCDDDNKTNLSLDYISHDCSNSSSVSVPKWLIDQHDYMSEVVANLLEEELKKILTDVQLEVYVSCIRGGITPTDYAKQHGITRQSVEDTIDQIRKKSKNFFE